MSYFRSTACCSSHCRDGTVISDVVSHLPSWPPGQPEQFVLQFHCPPLAMSYASARPTWKPEFHAICGSIQVCTRAVFETISSSWELKRMLNRSFGSQMKSARSTWSWNAPVLMPVVRLVM